MKAIQVLVVALAFACGSAFAQPGVDTEAPEDTYLNQELIKHIIDAIDARHLHIESKGLVFALYRTYLEAGLNSDAQQSAQEIRRTLEHELGPQLLSEIDALAEDVLVATFETNRQNLETSAHQWLAARRKMVSPDPEHGFGDPLGFEFYRKQLLFRWSDLASRIHDYVVPEVVNDIAPLFADPVDGMARFRGLARTVEFLNILTPAGQKAAQELTQALQATELFHHGIAAASFSNRLLRLAQWIVFCRGGKTHLEDFEAQKPSRAKVLIIDDPGSSGPGRPNLRTFAKYLVSQRIDLTYDPTPWIRSSQLAGQTVAYFREPSDLARGRIVPSPNYLFGRIRSPLDPTGHEISHVWISSIDSSVFGFSFFFRGGFHRVYDQFLDASESLTHMYGIQALVSDWNRFARTNPVGEYPLAEVASSEVAQTLEVTERIHKAASILAGMSSEQLRRSLSILGFGPKGLRLNVNGVTDLKAINVQLPELEMFMVSSQNSSARQAIERFMKKVRASIPGTADLSFYEFVLDIETFSAIKDFVALRSEAMSLIESDRDLREIADSQLGIAIPRLRAELERLARLTRLAVSDLQEVSKGLRTIFSADTDEPTRQRTLKSLGRLIGDTRTKMIRHQVFNYRPSPEKSPSKQTGTIAGFLRKLLGKRNADCESTMKPTDRKP